MGLEQLTDTALHEAVRFGDISEIRQAIKDGCDPNQIGIYQWSPLHEAAHNGDVDIVQLLLQTGGDANKRDMLRGCTAVHYAATQGYMDCLKLLLVAGGRYNILNDAGKSCYDVATNDCKLILEQQRDASEVYSEKKKEQISESDVEAVQHQNVIQKQLSSDAGSILELDSVSMATSNGSNSSCSRTCSTESVWSTTRDPVLGHIQLSFEYNVKQQTLKIRVWQLQDLLLPPANTSMISNIYVKSYLQPDKKKVTRRKTEELPVNTSSHSSHSKKKPQCDMMTPSCFKFIKALEYSSITAAMVTERIVDINVCITQKYTHRSFTIARWHMSLDVAVKKLRKEKFMLRPLIRAEIPENMKVYYCPSELEVVSPSQRNFSSDPNLQRSHSISSICAVPYSCRAASDSDLKQVAIGNSMKQKIPSIEIMMPQSEEDAELQDALRQILVMEMGEKSRSESNDDVIEMHDLDGDGGSNTIQVEIHKAQDKSVRLPQVKIVDGSVVVTNTNQVEVHVEETDFLAKDDSVRLSQVMIGDDAETKDVVISMSGVTASRKEELATGTLVEAIEMGSLDLSSDHFLNAQASGTTGKQKKSRKKKTLPNRKTISDVQLETLAVVTRSTKAQLPMATVLDLPIVHSSCTKSGFETDV